MPTCGVKFCDFCWCPLEGDNYMISDDDEEDLPKPRDPLISEEEWMRRRFLWLSIQVERLPLITMVVG